MIFIPKNSEPEALKVWREKNPGEGFSALTKEAKHALQLSLMDEQGYVCCFCGIYIGEVDDTGNVIPTPVGDRPSHRAARVAHITPQAVSEAKVVEYGNLCISCPAASGRPANEFCHCDKEQGNRTLEITPLQEDCISFFEFSLEGEITPNSNRDDQGRDKSKKTIKALNLNAGRLCTRRKEALAGAYDVISGSGESLNDFFDRMKAKKNGKYEEFYYVILSHFGVEGYT